MKYPSLLKYAAVLGCGVCLWHTAAYADDDQASRTETRTLQPFQALELDVAAEAVYKVAPTTTVTITAPAKLLPVLLTSVDGDKLVIKPKDHADALFDSVDQKQVKIHIAGPSLHAVELNSSGDLKASILSGDSVTVVIRGSGDLNADLVQGQQVKINVRGSGNAHVVAVAAQSVDAGIAGSGDIELAGQTDRLQAAVAGSGDVRAKNLKARALTAQVTGSGEIRAYASTSVVATSSGSGAVIVDGNPAQRQVQTAGSGDVEFK
jgi:hypothetical protein